VKKGFMREKVETFAEFIFADNQYYSFFADLGEVRKNKFRKKKFRTNIFRKQFLPLNSFFFRYFAIHRSNL